MPDDVAILDEPAVDTGFDGTDTGTSDSTTSDPGTESSNEGEKGVVTDQVEGQEPQTTGETPLIGENKALSPRAKATLEEIKAKDPKLAAQIRHALYKADQFSREVPGGLKEVAELRQALEELGGTEGIHQLQAKQGEYQALDEQFAKSDPKFVDAMALQDPLAFQRLAPSVFSKFQELNPEGYGSYVAQVFLADAQSEKLPITLELLQHFIAAGDGEKANQQLAKLGAYFQRLESFATKPVAPGKQLTAPDEREQTLNKREEDITRNEWNSARVSASRSIIDPEFKRLTDGKTISDQQRTAIMEVFGSRFSAALNKLPGHKEKVDRYFASRDRDGYLRYMNAIYKQEIPKALRVSVDAVVPAGLPAKTAAARSAPARTAAPTITQKEPGYLRVASAPSKGNIDFRKTSADMIREGKAILSDGRKVQWK